MSDTLRVTVAPGSTYTLSSHPSGLACLPPLELREGQTFDASPAEAQRLYDERRIVHWATSEAKPWPSRLSAPLGGIQPVVTISYGAGPMRRADNQDWVMDAAQAENDAQAQYVAKQNAELAVKNAAIRPHNAVGPARMPAPPPPPQAGDEYRPIDPFGAEHASFRTEIG